MDLSDLTPAQANALAQRLATMLGYLVRLTDRMQQRGWKSQDPAYCAARDAHHRLHDLVVRLCGLRVFA